MMKFFKKAMSALLATVMCIPSGLLTIANATEGESTNGEYTVTLTDTENGIMQFSENSISSTEATQEGYQMVQVDEDGNLNPIENDGSIWSFYPGDKVEIELIPDEGYSVSSFTIKNASNGNVMAHKQTNDNVFSFTMPSKSLMIEATFTNGKVVDIIDDGIEVSNEEEEIEIEYHDITESSEISKQETEEVIADIVTESYIKSHINTDYMTISKEQRLSNVLIVKNTLFNGLYVEEDDTIDSIMNSISEGDENWEANGWKVMGQIVAYVYDMNPESDYYVGKYIDERHWL